MTYVPFALFDQPVRTDFARGFFLAAKGVSDLFAAWQERSYQRQQLAQLDHRMLKDIGLSRSEAAHEANKPFWRE